MKRLKEEVELREYLRSRFYREQRLESNALITALIRAVREEVLQVVRECHYHHRCNHLNPCKLCRLLNPNWEQAVWRHVL